MEPPEAAETPGEGERPPAAGYCVACRSKREMVDTKRVERGGGPAIEGTCAVCGVKMFVLGAETPDV